MSPVLLEGADLRHVDTWLFDLDNTLYPRESGLGALMEPRITDFMMETTGLDRPAAHALQKQYLLDHGLTLRGLMLHHQTNPDIYHARFHDLPLEALSRDERLRAAIGALPGRRLIFTNADEVHTRRVTERLGLDDLFQDVFHIGSADFQPKPAPAAFAAILREHAIRPLATAFFEDSLVNLRAGKAVGMTTVLVGAATPGAQDEAASDFVDHRAADLASFLAAARTGDAP